MNVSRGHEASALPYQEPSIKTILTQSSFLLLLNAMNHVMDKLLYCGLIGQIILGVAYGTPSLNAPLAVEAQRVIVQMGYLGLILLVFEGGLGTNFASVKANFWLSACVALTGIVAPIGFSFVLMALAGASPLQAFSAGAALCSTSLGSTFTVMGATGLLSTRMGVVLTSAAMMDDVVGLVMVQVIANLGDPNTSFSAITVVRPVLVSMAFAVIIPLLARLSSTPLAATINRSREAVPMNWSQWMTNSPIPGLLIQTVLLIGLVVASTYAGTSNLFAAYVAGALINWWDSLTPHDMPDDFSGTPDGPTYCDPSSIHKNQRGSDIFRIYYAPVLNRVLRPFFFASIGFSIPISRMFSGSIVWRGIIYTTLMILSKALCGIWLIRFQPRASHNGASKSSSWTYKILSWLKFARGSSGITYLDQDTWIVMRSTTQARQVQFAQPVRVKPVASRATSDLHMSQTSNSEGLQPSSLTSGRVSVSGSSHKLVSLYPAAIISGAMVSRGEIGFLVSSVAEAKGILTSRSGNDDIFLIITWAIMLCTVVSPVTVGFLVKRVRRLEEARSKENKSNETATEILGIWGVKQRRSHCQRQC